MVDLDSERQRLGKELARSDKDISGLSGRLSNPGFTDKAPPEVVAEFQQKLEAARQRRDSLQRALAALTA